MRLVLDTNIVLSGLLWDGPPARLIDAALSQEVELFTSKPLIERIHSS
jgi:putative PIN family toxin of toxin-antitoxin system